MGSDGERSHGFWRTGLGYVTQIGIILGAVAAIIGGIASLSSDDGGPGGGDPTPQVADLTVAGGLTVKCVNAPPDPPRLDMTIRNPADQPTVIKRLGFRVRASGLLRIPQAGGGLEPSKAYDVLLPARPRIGQLLLYKVSQKIEPHDVDRFTVRLDEPEPERQLGSRLYQLDVLLYHDIARSPIKAGTVLVSAPALPDKSYFWSGVAPARRAGYGNKPLPTMTTNEKTLRRMLALPGERAPELSGDLVDAPVSDERDGNPCRSRKSARAQPPLPEEPSP
jgi:hypothetical protein